MDGSGDVLESSAFTNTAGPETQTFAVLPSTTYNFWVGLYQGSTPVTDGYKVTLCGEAFTF